MKVFIWHKEYEYYICIANTEQEARKKIEEIWDYENDYRETPIDGPPFAIIDDNKAHVFDHSNE